MAERNFHIGIVQMSCTPEPEQNLERAIAHVRDAAGKGAEIICLPELFQTQYFCQREDIALFDLAEPIPGPTTKRLGELARELKITIIASLFERRAPGLYHNTAAVIDCGRQAGGIYRKMHIPDDPLYYEKFYFTPGDLGFKTFETDFGKFGTLVCWDQWYPEGARLTALQGANVLVLSDGHRLASGREGAVRRGAVRRVAHHPARARHRQRSLCRRAQSRGLRDRQHSRQRGAGQGPGILGRIVYRRSLWADHRRRPRTTRKRCWSPRSTLKRMEDVRRNWPFWRDRRVDAYAPITQRFMV